MDTEEEILEEAEAPELVLHKQIEQLQDQLSTALANEREAGRKLELFKEQVVRVSRRYAEDHDMCSVYDDCMEELGLPRRAQPWTVYVRVHYTQQVTVTAESYAEACRKVNQAEERTHSVLGVPFRCDDLEVETYSSGFEWEVRED